jgi:hypothetical protein
MKLEAEALEKVQQALPQIGHRGPFSDCAAAS